MPGLLRPGIFFIYVSSLDDEQVEVEESLLKIRCGGSDTEDVIANDHKGVRQSLCYMSLDEIASSSSKTRNDRGAQAIAEFQIGLRVMIIAIFFMNTSGWSVCLCKSDNPDFFRT